MEGTQKKGNENCSVYLLKGHKKKEGMRRTTREEETKEKSVWGEGGGPLARVSVFGPWGLGRDY